MSKKTVSVRRTQVIHSLSLSFAPSYSRILSSSCTHTYLLLSLLTRAFICMQTELIAKNRTELIFVISFTYMSRPMLNAIMWRGVVILLRAPSLLLIWRALFVQANSPVCSPCVKRCLCTANKYPFAHKQARKKVCSRAKSRCFLLVSECVFISCFHSYKLLPFFSCFLLWLRLWFCIWYSAGSVYCKLRAELFTPTVESYYFAIHSLARTNSCTTHFRCSVIWTRWKWTK